MNACYIDEHDELLGQICNDILCRPLFYMPGAQFLEKHYGPDRPFEEAKADWNRFKDHPAEKGLHNVIVEERTQGIADEFTRDIRKKELLHQLSAEPQWHLWSPPARVCRAIQSLSALPENVHDDAWTKAICILAVLLWDKNADKRHPIFNILDLWGSVTAEYGQTPYQWAAAYFLQGNGLQNWMKIVRVAWEAVPKARRATGQLTAERNADQAKAEAYYAPSDIAKAMGVPEHADAIRVALKRLFGKRKLPDEAWLENRNPAKNQAKLLYRLRDVRPFLSRFEPDNPA